MAVDDFDDVKDEDLETAEKSRPKSGMLMVIVGGLILILLSAAVTFFVVKATVKSSPSADIPEPEVGRSQGSPVLYPIQDIYVNIAGTRSTRVLKINPVLELSEDRMKVTLDEFKPLVRDKIAQVARSMTLDEMEKPKGAEVLKKEIRDALNRAFKNRMDGVIIAVHFDDFLIQ